MKDRVLEEHSTERIWKNLTESFWLEEFSWKIVMEGLKTECWAGGDGELFALQQSTHPANLIATN